MRYGKKLEQPKEDSSNQINQLEVCLMVTLDEFEQYIHHSIPAYNSKEQVQMLKNEIEMLKRENKQK